MMLMSSLQKPVHEPNKTYPLNSTLYLLLSIIYHSLYSVLYVQHATLLLLIVNTEHYYSALL